LNLCTQWNGVECDSTQQWVTSIDVTATGLGGYLSTDIGSLIYLTRLDMHSSSLSGTIPLEIGTFTFILFWNDDMSLYDNLILFFSFLLLVLMK
jgi:hypothetical protein